MMEYVMTRDEALALHAELERLAAGQPGDLSETVQRRLKQIENAFRFVRDDYLSEKAFAACEFLEIWLSPTKWRQRGSDPTLLKAIVANDVANVRRAIESHFPPPVEREG
jgi:hypothetical protein